MFIDATRLPAAVAALFALVVTLWAGAASAQVPIDIYQTLDWQQASVHLVNGTVETDLGDVWISEKADALAWSLTGSVAAEDLDGTLELRPVGVTTPPSHAVYAGLNIADVISAPTTVERVHLIDDGAGVTVGAIGLELEDCTTKACPVKSVTWTAFAGSLLPTAMMTGDIDLLPAVSFPVATGDLQVEAEL